MRDWPPFLNLAIAIVLEVFGSVMLRVSDGMTRWQPTVAVFIAYALSFWVFSFTLKSIPAGIAYAIWSGVGIVSLAAIGWIWFRQPLNTPAMVGIGLILAGVLVINLFSAGHGA